MTTAGEEQPGSTGEVKESGPLEISEQDDRKYRHITLPNKMQVRQNATRCFIRISNRPRLTMPNVSTDAAACVTINVVSTLRLCTFLVP